MRCSMRFITTASSLVLLAGCATRPAPEPAVEYREAAIAVAVGCVIDRPAPVPALNASIGADAWAARAPGAKAQAVRAQAGRRLNYEDSLAASTSGCAPAPTR